MVASTRRPEVLGGLGDFGGLFALDTSRYRRPVLVSGTDGVGTKAAVAQAVGRLDTVGIDLVAMCVDDLVCQGAEPLFLLDYISTGSVEPARMADLVSGVAEGCRQVGATLLGGEMAEHAGIMARRRVRPGRLRGGGGRTGRDPRARTGSCPGTCCSDCRRRGCGRTATPWPATCCSSGRACGYDDPAWPGADTTVADELLRPSVIYTPAVRAAMAAADVHAVAHITGGGFGGNIPRALPEGAGPCSSGGAGRSRRSSPRSGGSGWSTTTRWPGCSTSGSGWWWWCRPTASVPATAALSGRRGRPGARRLGRGGRAGRGADRPAAVGELMGHRWTIDGAPTMTTALPDTPFEALRAHLLEHSVKRGDFTLKSGRTSSWFIDSKQTVCRPEAMVLVADGILSVVPDDVDAIGGLTMGADPVAFVTAGVAATRGRALKAFSVRKEAKDHGAGGRIAGALDPGDRVVITEDTVTRGTSLLEAAPAVREFGAEPVLLVAVVDRGGTCAAMAAAEGLEFRALLTAPDLGFDYEGA